MSGRHAIFFLFLFGNLFFGAKNLYHGAYVYALIDFAIAGIMVYFTYGSIRYLLSDLKSFGRKLFK